MNLHDRCIALAGCVQHTWWAHRLAQHGEYREDHLQSAVNAILCTDPGQAMDVFGSLADLQTGIKVSTALLKGRAEGQLQSQESALITNYTGQLIRLGAQVSRSSAARSSLATAISTIKQDLKDGRTRLPDLVTRSAQIYVANISSLTPRIMVQGNGIYLRNETFAAGIRTHLLAAVRASVLWRQCGGRLWLMMFQRSAYLREMRALLAVNGS